MEFFDTLVLYDFFWKLMNQKYQEFGVWLRKPLGQTLLQMEQKILKSYWKSFLGEYLFILGDAIQYILVEESQSQKKFILTPNDCRFMGRTNLIYTQYEALPILPDSADVIVLPHILEFSEDAYQVLREVEIALRPEGDLIIVGFNPFSFWGLRRLFHFRKKVPWSGIFRRSGRIRDWLQVLNFEVVFSKKGFYRPPLNNQKLFGHLKFIEKLCQLCLPCLGGIYIILAKKKVFSATAIKSQWKQVSYVGNGVVEPIRRGMVCEEDS